MNYLTRLYNAFWGDDDNLTEEHFDWVESNVDTHIEKLWQEVHAKVALGGQPLDPEKVTEFKNFLDWVVIQTQGSGGDFLRSHPDLAWRVQDLIVIMAICCADTNLDPKLCDSFEKLFRVSLEAVLQRDVVLKTETHVSFRMPSKEEFSRTVTTYVNTIDKLRPSWKKRVYFVQMLNYVINHREVHVWTAPLFYEAMMEKIRDCERGGMPLPWHRKMLTRRE